MHVCKEDVYVYHAYNNDNVISNHYSFTITINQWLRIKDIIII